jgi:DNA polymerase-3 subunit delta
MVITVTGDNQHQVRVAVKKVVDNFTAQHGALAVERFEAGETEAEHILSAVSATSLLSPSKLVLIQDFEINKALTEKTEELLSQVADGTTVVIVIGKLDKRVSYGKLLKKETDFQEFAALSPVDTINWITQTVKDRGGQIDRGTAQYLIDFVGANQERLSNELDKLILFDTEVTRASVDQLSEREPTSTVFELLDAGFNGQEGKTLKLYDEQRRQQVEPLAIIGMIGWQLHILAVVKTATDKSANDIAKDAGVHPFVIQKSLKLAQQMALSKLRELVHQAVVLEEQLKNRTMNADDAVKHFLLSLATS